MNKYIFNLIIAFSLFFSATFCFASDEATLKSDNLLYNAKQANPEQGVILDSFSYSGFVPEGADLKIKFSPDGINWYNSYGQPYIDGRADIRDVLKNTLNDDNNLKDDHQTCENGICSIKLSLPWTSPDFYYEIGFNSSNSEESPVLQYTSVNFKAGEFIDEGILTSTNLLENKGTINSIDSLKYNAFIPEGAYMKIRFSQTGEDNDWRNEYNVLYPAGDSNNPGGWNAVKKYGTSGEYTIELNNFNPSANLYYQIQFNQSPEGESPVLQNIVLTYTGYEATLVSSNLLEDIGTAKGIDSFSYSAFVPEGSELAVKFSKDKVNWYNSRGTLITNNNFGQHNLCTSSKNPENPLPNDTVCLDGVCIINLSALNWSGAEFYYHFGFNDNSKGESPIVHSTSFSFKGDESTLTSSNLLDNAISVTAINSLKYSAFVPEGAKMEIKFSNDGVHWYNSNEEVYTPSNSSYNWDYLIGTTNPGEVLPQNTTCLDGYCLIDLTALTNAIWKTPHANFYYQIGFNSNSEGESPVLHSIDLDFKGEFMNGGLLTSSNLLENTGVNHVDRFNFETFIPEGAKLQFRFSQDGINWYDSAGLKYTTLATDGTYLWDRSRDIFTSGGSKHIILSAFSDWNDPNFYYQVLFTENSSDESPVLQSVGLDYNGYEGSIISNNLLVNLGSINSIDTLEYTAFIPEGADIAFKFSQTGNVDEEWTKYCHGIEISPNHYAIDLAHELRWAGSNLYYQAGFNPNSEGESPVLQEVKLTHGGNIYIWPIINSATINKDNPDICKLGEDREEAGKTICQSGKTITFESIASYEEEVDEDGRLKLYISETNTDRCDSFSRTKCLSYSGEYVSDNPTSTFDIPKGEYSTRSYWAKACTSKWCSDLIDYKNPLSFITKKEGGATCSNNSECYYGNCEGGICTDNGPMTSSLITTNSNSYYYCDKYFDEAWNLKNGIDGVIVFNANYSDLKENPIKSFNLKVSESETEQVGGFKVSVPYTENEIKLFSGIKNNPDESSHELAYNKKYYWWIQVCSTEECGEWTMYQDETDTDGDLDPKTFTTPSHKYPFVRVVKKSDLTAENIATFCTTTNNPSDACYNTCFGGGDDLTISEKNENYKCSVCYNNDGTARACNASETYEWKLFNTTDESNPNEIDLTEEEKGGSVLIKTIEDKSITKIQAKLKISNSPACGGESKSKAVKQIPIWREIPFD